MNDPIKTFSLAYTSCRPNLIKKVIDYWLSHASDPTDVEVVVSVDGNNSEAIRAARSLNKGVKVVIQNEGPFNSVRGWNAAAEATTGKVIIGISDDIEPPRSWDRSLKNLPIIGADWINGDYVIHVEDGYVHDICVLPIITRSRYSKFGYLFYPQYESMFCLGVETPIWMGNLSFKQIQDVKVNDTVIGSNYRYGDRSEGTHRRNFLEHTSVTAINRRISDTVVVTMESGRILQCTYDHFWAYYGDKRKPKSGKRREGFGNEFVENGFLYGNPRKGRRLVNVVDSTPHLPKSTEEISDLGWLAGMMDGEGTFPCITQSLTHNPELCYEIERLLNKYGISFSLDRSQTTYSPTGDEQIQRVFTFTGGKSSYMDFLKKVPMRKKGSAIKRLLRSRFGSKDAIVSIEPGGEAEVICLSTGLKNYVAGGYLSHNCDTEFTHVAQRDGVIIEAKNLVFEHKHPDCGKRQRDANDLVHASKDRWNRGEMLFNMRRQRNFPLDAGPLQETISGYQPNTSEKYVAYIQATCDDISLNEVVGRLFDEGIRDFFFCIPNEYWSGEINTEEGIEQVKAAAAILTNRGANVLTKVFDVSLYRFEGDSRIAVETRVRNDSLEWIRGEGIEHICIVDGDELWAVGTLDKIKGLVKKCQPHAINIPMVPVVGLPGYPIDRARDRVVSYVSGKIVLRDCRTPIGIQQPLDSTCVYHFTGTRRTMDEIVDKHRRSGHYDDPSYDFEGWIKNILPNIKPGMKNIHMYKNYQIWPAIRNWTLKEYMDIPESLHQYLAKPATQTSVVGSSSESGVPHVPTPKVHEFKLSRTEKLTGKPDNAYRQT